MFLLTPSSIYKAMAMIGYQRICQGDFMWRKHQSTLIPLSMPHREAGLTRSGALALLALHRAPLIRWESDFDCDTPTEWWHIIKSEEERLESLSSKTRSKVRRGMRQFRIERSTRDTLLAEGYAVYTKAYERYDTFEPIMSQADFVAAIRQLPPETEFWEVRDREKGELVAFGENLVVDDACFSLSLWFTPASLKQYASYALIHLMNCHYLNERKVKYVSNGARSISHDTGMHDFLMERFNFRKAYARLHVVYFPLLSPLVHGLYPFRQPIQQAKGSLFRKLAVLLEQERIRRSFPDEHHPRLDPSS
ncbi:hypothetical protein ACM26W_11500 [Halomonas sp. HK25]|uniref:hypothetical protein n=1 Tax=Halomonas sp. HK25 TaxID=3394321 RepID=UPI0039FD48AB